MFNKEKYENYVKILHEELVPAMGCTEPISIAYCAALVKKTLGNIPNKIIIKVSGNIIKNVKSVIVPHTNGMYGIDSAACIGLLAGNPDVELQVISNVREEDIEKLPDFKKNLDVTIENVDNEHILYIEIIGYLNDDYARVIIQDSHTHVYLIEKNNVILVKNEKELKTNACC